MNPSRDVFMKTAAFCGRDAEKLYTSYLSKGMDIRLGNATHCYEKSVMKLCMYFYSQDMSTLSQAGDSNPAIAAALFKSSDPLQAPRFFSFDNFSHCSRLLKCLPEGYAFRIYTATSYVKMFDNGALQAVMRRPFPRYTLTLLYDVDTNVVSVCPPHLLLRCNPIACEAALAKRIQFASSPELAVCALFPSLALQGRGDLLNLMSQSNYVKKDLRLQILYNKGCGARKKDTFLSNRINALSVGKIGNAEGRLIYVFISNDSNTKEFAAFTVDEIGAERVRSGLLEKRLKTSKEAYRFGMTEPLPTFAKKKESRERENAQGDFKCKCEICEQAYLSHRHKITPDGPEKNFNYKSDAREYYEILGFNEHLPALERCFEVSLAAMDLESVTVSVPEAGDDACVFDSVTREKHTQTGLAATQIPTLLGLGWNFKAAPSSMNVEIFDVGANCEREMSRFCATLLEISKDLKEYKLDLLRPVITKLHGIYEAHCRFFEVSGKSENEAEEAWSGTIFYRCQEHLNRISNTTYVGSLNGTSYDHPLIG